MNTLLFITALMLSLVDYLTPIKLGGVYVPACMIGAVLVRAAYKASN